MHSGKSMNKRKPNQYKGHKNTSPKIPASWTNAYKQNPMWQMAKIDRKTRHNSGLQTKKLDWTEKSPNIPVESKASQFELGKKRTGFFALPKIAFLFIRSLTTRKTGLFFPTFFSTKSPNFPACRIKGFSVSCFFLILA